MDNQTLQVLLRAKAAIDSAALQLSDTRPSRRRTPAPPEASKVCQACKEAKTKCKAQPGLPCIRCANAGVLCEYPFRSKPGRKVTSFKGTKLLEAQHDLNEVLRQLNINSSNASPASTSSQSAIIPTMPTASSSRVTLEAIPGQIVVLSPESEDSDKNGSEESLHHNTASNYVAADSLQVDSSTGDFVFMGPTSVPKRPHSVRHLLSSRRFLPFSSPPDFDLGSLGVTRETHDELIDLFFRHLNGTVAFIHESAFLAGMHSAISIPNSVSGAYSNFLHLCILASASHLSDRPEVEAPGLPVAEAKGWPFLQRAIEALEAEIRQPRATTVQGITLLIMCLADLGETSMSWIYCGIAVRVSQDLGLNVDSRPLVERGLITAEVCSLREAAFWTIYVQDKLLSLYVGRVPSLTETDHGLVAPNPGTLTPIMTAMVSLSDILTHITRLLYNVSGRRSDSRVTLECVEKDLDAWPSSVPPALVLEGSSSRQIVTLHCLHNTAVILLNRPLLRRRCLDAPQGQRSFEAALRTFHWVHLFNAQHSIKLCPVTMCQNLYVAASFLLLLTADLYDQNERKNENELAAVAVDGLMRLLQEMAPSWGCAGQALSALKKMQEDYTGRESRASEEITGLGDLGRAWQDDWMLTADLGWPTFEESLGLQGDHLSSDLYASMPQW